MNGVIGVSIYLIQQHGVTFLTSILIGKDMEIFVGKNAKHIWMFCSSTF